MPLAAYVARTVEHSLRSGVLRLTPRRLGGNRRRVVEKPPAQIEVELGEAQAEGIYSNLVFIAHSASEVILDFARALPGLPKAKVYARVILTPQHAKSLLLALDQNLKNYETQFGPIKVPGNEVNKKEIGFKTT
jgi:uncharacterized protein DUF3467